MTPVPTKTSKKTSSRIKKTERLIKNKGPYIIMSEFEDYQRYMKMKRMKSKPKQKQQMQQHQPQLRNLYSNNPNQGTMLKFNSIQPRNYKQMLKQAKQKQAYKSYIKQQRTQKIGNAYNAAKGTAQITKQASSNLFDKAKQLYNKRKRVGYQKQY